MTATGKVIYGWDSRALTLFGVLYGIVATVVGVIVAPYGMPETAIYAAITLVFLALCLLSLRVAQWIIPRLRWLLARGAR